MIKNRDRRVQRTQQLLRESLFTLIQERGFEKLSVQDIIDRANIGRATFYAHFDNKEDLLFSGFDTLRTSLRTRQRVALARKDDGDKRLFAYSHDLLSHVYEHRHLFQAMLRESSGTATQNALHRLAVSLVRDDLRAVQDRIDGPADPNEAVVEFIAGGLFGLVMWWLNGKAMLSIEEVDSLFRSLAIPATKARA
jgi:AcrR family transcriptional regulator